jgi:hypothetical protein
MSALWLAVRIVSFPFMLAFMLAVLFFVTLAAMAIWVASGSYVDINGHMPGWPR